MLDRTPMRSAVLSSVLLAASASSAFAGGYVAPGVGTSPATSGDLGLVEDGRSLRLQIGYRIGRFSVEGVGAKADLLTMNAWPMNWMTVGVAAKYNIPIGDSFEIFGRGGLQHSSVSHDNDDAHSYSGNGFLVGAGVEYRLPTALVGASLFVDYLIEDSDTTPVAGDPIPLGLTTRVWTMGAILYL